MTKCNCFLFRNQISRWHPFKKKSYFDLLFTLLNTRKKTRKFLQHISHLHTYTFLLTQFAIFVFPILRNCSFIMHCFSLGCLRVLVRISAFLELSILYLSFFFFFELWVKFKLECLLLIFMLAWLCLNSLS